MLAVRLLDSVDDVFGQHRLDFVVDAQFDDSLRRAKQPEKLTQTRAAAVVVQREQDSSGQDTQA